MTPIYHNKFHGKNHHTIATDVLNYPDAAKDPIASPESPFQGDFVCADTIYSYDDNLAATFKNKNIAMYVSGSNNTVCLSTTDDVLFYNQLTANTLSFSEKGMYSIDYVNTNNNDNGTFWVVILSGVPYGLRLWDTENTVTPEVQLPFFINDVEVIKNVPKEFIEVINIDVRGTEPIQKQWYLNGIALIDQDRSFIRTNINGVYQMVATNSQGSVSSKTITLTTDLSIPHFINEFKPIVVSGVYAAVYELTSIDDSITLNVSAIGPGPIYYNWFKDQNALHYYNDTKIQIFSTEHDGLSSVYYATATNYNGTATSQKFIVYNTKPASKIFAISLSGDGDVLITSDKQLSAINQNITQDLDYILS